MIGTIGWDIDLLVNQGLFFLKNIRQTITFFV